MSIGSIYRGREGMISWALHRITGLGVLLFLLIHIADIYIIRYGANAFDDLLVIYKGLPFPVSGDRSRRIRLLPRRQRRACHSHRLLGRGG